MDILTAITLLTLTLVSIRYDLPSTAKCLEEARQGKTEHNSEELLPSGGTDTEETSKKILSPCKGSECDLQNITTDWKNSEMLIASNELRTSVENKACRKNTTT